MADGILQGVGEDHIWLPIKQEVEVKQLPCPKSRVWSTSVSRLYVAMRSAAESRPFPPLDAIEVDVTLQMSVQQLYLQQQMAVAVEPVAAEDRLRCQLLWQLMPEQRLLTAGQDGRFLLRRGQIIYELSCHAVVLEVDHQEWCYQGCQSSQGSRP